MQSEKACPDGNPARWGKGLKMNDFMFYRIDKRAQSRAARWLLWLTISSVLGFIAWSYFANLDEVAVGQGKVVPSSKEQIIQSLESGTLDEMMVKEGMTVEKGQILATLHPIAAQSSVGEASARLSSLQAKAARLTAEMSDSEDVKFPDALLTDKDVVDRERELFNTNRKAFKDNIKNLEQQHSLSKKELDLAIPLLKTGAATEVEVLRLRQKLAELDTRLQATRSEYGVSLRNEFTKTMAEIEPLQEILKAKADQLQRTTIVAPLRGIVKDIRVNTKGGVISSGGTLMVIVPLDDQLLIETKINPRDIAFIKPDQEANVKITAYDQAIYGSLKAKVQRISPDSLVDEVDRRSEYYRVYVITDNAYLETKDGKRHPISPGMIATSEIKTGNRTVMQYLIKPLNRASEALRER